MSSRPFPPPRRRSAFTLLEVAIALVIFMIGALAIVRIFPPALGLVENSGERAVALNLNAGLLARFANNPLEVPDAVYQGDVNFPFAYDNSFTGVVLPNTARNLSLPGPPGETAVADYTTSSLGNMLAVQGERHKLIHNGATYVLTNFPFREAVAYAEDEVEGVTIDAAGNMDFRNATLKSNGISIADATLPNLPAGALSYNGSNVGSTTFYVSYRWLNGGSGYPWGVTDEPVQFSGTALTQLGPSYTTGNTFVAGPVQVRLRQVKKLIVPDADTGTGLDFDGNRGLVTLTNQEDDFPNNIVSVDYSVRGWDYLTVDSAPAGQRFDEGKRTMSVSLPARGVDDAEPGFRFSLVQIGATLTKSADNNGSDPGEFHTMTRGDRRQGTARIIANIGEPIKALRVVYKTVDRWTQQLAVANSSYLPVDGNSAGNVLEPWRHYYVSGNSLIFHTSEAGKAVYVDYTYDDAPLGKTITARKKLLRIREEPTTAPSPPTGFTSDGRGAMVELTDSEGTPIAGANLRAIVAVRGASILSRTAWISNGRYAQNGNTSYREAS